MNRIFAGLLVLVCTASNAALIDRGGGLIYDSTLDVTWLQDANYARTTGYSPDGRMNWSLANTWAANLGYYDAVRDVTWDDWRLPMTLQPDSSCSFQYDVSGWPLQGNGYGCTSSEMGHLFNVDGISQTTPGSFLNVQDLSYWSGTAYAPLGNYAWHFNLYWGTQDYDAVNGSLFALAVRDGDVSAVPAPGTFWLLVTAFTAFCSRRTWLQR
jgi:hypothetical protein